MATAAAERDPVGRARPRPRRVRSPFHVVAALVIAAAMVVGFGLEAPRYVIHPNAHRPLLLLVHSVVFVSWMALYVAQAVLVQKRNVRLHRRLGWAGAGLAAVMPPLGVATALVMRRFDLATFPSHDPARDLAFLATTLADIVAFTPCAWLGIALRKRPDVHSRLMFLAIAAISEAGFGRLPIPGVTGIGLFFGNLALYGAAMLHDRLTLGHVHRVYRWTVPLIVLDEAIAMYLWQVHPAWWVAICRSLTGIG